MEEDLYAVRTLWASVLGRAVQDHAILENRKLADPGVLESYAFKKSYGEIRRWFTSRVSKPGSFVWICNALSLNPSWVLSKVRVAIDDYTPRGTGCQPQRPVIDDNTWAHMRCELRRRYGTISSFCDTHKLSQNAFYNSRFYRTPMQPILEREFGMRPGSLYDSPICVNTDIL